MTKINLNISKRKRFVLSSIILTFLIIAINNPIQYSIFNTLVIFLAVAIITYLLTWWSLKEDMRGIEFITLFTIPVLYTVGTLFFIQVLPERKLYRYPIILMYPISMYAIFLTNNIFNVAAIRTIQLLRAARAVSYLMTILTTYYVITSLTAQIDEIFPRVLLAIVCIGLISYQFFWSFDLGKGEGSKVNWYTLTTTLLLAEIILLLQIIPINPALEGLIIIASLYSILGLSTHYLERKLTKRIASEYIIITFLIVSLVYYTLPWTG